MKYLLYAACAVALAGACTSNTHKNPFLSAYTTPYEIPPFDSIS